GVVCVRCFRHSGRWGGTRCESNPRNAPALGLDSTEGCPSQRPVGVGGQRPPVPRGARPPTLANRSRPRYSPNRASFRALKGRRRRFFLGGWTLGKTGPSATNAHGEDLGMAISEDYTRRIGNGVAQRFELKDLVSEGTHTLVLAGEFDMTTAPGVETMVVASAAS